jgi:transcriptional regulator with XRE-family HTH domain
MGIEMLSPEEIKAKLILKKKTQSEVAERMGISRSQLSTIIKHTNKASIELTKIIGENPFQMSPAELKKYSKKKG